MALNQAQQLELQNILESPTFKAAQAEVLQMSDGSLGDLLAPEAAIKMAIEKGVRNAFRLLHVVAKPIQYDEPLKPRSTTRTK